MPEHQRSAAAHFFLASIVDSSQDSIVTVDFQGVITSWNQAAASLYGFRADEAVGKSLSQLTLPKDLLVVPRTIERIRQGETVPVFETIRLRKGGRPLHLEVVMSPVRDVAGQVMGVSTIARDVSERKRLENNLAFLAEVSAEFAPLSTVDEIMERVGAKLAGYLHLSRCSFFVVDEAVDRIIGLYDWRSSEELPGLQGEHQLSSFLTATDRQQYSAGKMRVFEDGQEELASGFPLAHLPEEVLHAGAVSSAVDVPYLEHGRWKFLLHACRPHSPEYPREWAGDEIQLLEDLASRIYIRIERARAEAALRASEESLRRTHQELEIRV